MGEPNGFLYDLSLLQDKEQMSHDADTQTKRGRRRRDRKQTKHKEIN